MVEAKGCLFLPCSLAVTITPHMVEGTPERSWKRRLHSTEKSLSIIVVINEVEIWIENRLKSDLQPSRFEFRDIKKKTLVQIPNK